MKARIAVVVVLGAVLAACGAPALKARTAKPEFVGDRLLMDAAAVSEFKGTGDWWAAHYEIAASDRALFTPCAAPKDSLYTCAVMFPNSALYLDRDGAQRGFLVTPSPDEKLMWTSQDGGVLCTYPGFKGGSPTVEAHIGTWRGKKLLDLDGVRTGEFFLGTSGGFVHLTTTRLSAAEPAGGPVRVSLTFRDYGGRVLGIDSTGAPVLPRSWRVSHSPEARAFAFAASWRVERGANDSLVVFQTPQGRRLWSRALGGNPERVCVGPDGDRMVVAVALDDSTRRLSVFDRDGKAVGETEVHAGSTEDIALSCDGRLAFIVGRGFRALVRLDSGEFVYALTDPSLLMRKASVSNTGLGFTVSGPTRDPEKPVEAVLFDPTGRIYWRTASDASVPATDVWIAPDGAKIFLRVYNTLEMYE